MNESLTIVTSLVLSSSRKIQINRFVEFHKRHNCKIIIVKPDNVILPEINYKHIEIIDCSAELAVLDKFILGIEKVKTKYIAIVADDDFLCLDFANKAINLLDNDENISACDGLTIFKEEETGKRRNLLYSFRNYYHGIRFNKKCISRKHILRFQANHYNAAVLHGIMRTTICIEAIKFIKRLNVPTKWNDNLFVFIIMMYGKIYFIKSISSIRSHDTRLMIYDPNVFHKANTDKQHLIMDGSVFKELCEYYKDLKKGMSYTIASEILYYLLQSSFAFDKNFLKSKILLKSKEYFYIGMSYIEVFKFKIFNQQIHDDIELAEYLMKNFSLKNVRK